jgi:hypothetical protein
MKSGFFQYCLYSQKKELGKLVKLSKSKSHDKILTFAEFVLPVKVEAEIVYTVPITHSNQGVTTYLFFYTNNVQKMMSCYAKKRKQHKLSTRTRKKMMKVMTVTIIQSLSQLLLEVENV